MCWVLPVKSCGSASDYPPGAQWTGTLTPTLEIIKPRLRECREIAGDHTNFPLSCICRRHLIHVWSHQAPTLPYWQRPWQVKPLKTGYFKAVSGKSTDTWASWPQQQPPKNKEMGRWRDTPVTGECYAMGRASEEDTCNWNFSMICRKYPLKYLSWTVSFCCFLSLFAVGWFMHVG